MNRDVLKTDLPSNYCLLDKINEVTVIIGLIDNDITIQRIVVTDHKLSIRDISIPISHWTYDNRRTGDPIDSRRIGCGTANLDVAVNGIFQLKFRDHFRERKGAYFDYVQPQLHYNQCSDDGITCYKFCSNPEKYQQSSTDNLYYITLPSLTLNPL